ncbi:hypothetical protein DNJ95_01875 [Stutzerimonas kirkiae]|uniref:Prepilin-type N-terminal cleavage/methylation domain-containing protein n=2 Tax=Stutzerimonas kirkiae TaxID=2211392 RepID=A0A4Q9REL8_9GAMM|nr:hypothetical protein DNJ96_01205 [Stutzerimonas kirkiae]TBV05820.1 hypothetical protein DNJ95_01875 [Stutzerimonas kirkiae]TBV10663.1 hypothetical protein DNK08_06185 [Stutzerimonas kirkiae]TBV17620.1 hypothetical protein DNK01_01010 [Stutzerimonas kirkiae]
MTLVELVITIVILAIVLVALYSAQARIVGRSADPLLVQQALYIADSVLETLQAMPTVAGMQAEAALYANNSQSLPLPAALAAAYTVTAVVVVESVAGQNLNRITVTVTPNVQPGSAVTLAGYRGL